MGWLNGLDFRFTWCEEKQKKRVQKGFLEALRYASGNCPPEVKKHLVSSDSPSLSLAGKFAITDRVRINRRLSSGKGRTSIKPMDLLGEVLRDFLLAAQIER